MLGIGMLPPVRREAVATIANGAGFGAAQFLSNEGFARAIRIAEQAEQVDLDLDPNFIQRYVDAMALAPNGVG